MDVTMNIDELEVAHEALAAFAHDIRKGETSTPSIDEYEQATGGSTASRDLFATLCENLALRLQAAATASDERAAGEAEGFTPTAEQVDRWELAIRWVPDDRVYDLAFAQYDADDPRLEDEMDPVEAWCGLTPEQGEAALKMIEAEAFRGLWSHYAAETGR
jgi:hypothetical protein